MTPPALPLTVQRGRTLRQLATAVLLARGIPIVAVVLVLGGGAAVLEGNAGALLWPLAALAVVAAAVALVAVPLLVRAQRSTITVTDAELVVDVRRRLALPRAELTDVVVGHVTVPPGDPAAAQLCFVHAPVPPCSPPRACCRGPARTSIGCSPPSTGRRGPTTPRATSACARGGCGASSALRSLSRSR